MGSPCSKRRSVTDEMGAVTAVMDTLLHDDEESSTGTHGVNKRPRRPGSPHESMASCEFGWAGLGIRHAGINL